MSDSPPTAPLPMDLSPFGLERDKALARTCNLLAGQVSIGMANRDLAREDLAKASNVPEPIIRSVQAGEADGATVAQLFQMSAALGGRLIITIAMPPSAMTGGTPPAPATGS